jgi:predicted RNA-binding protein YlxR (DUF448 family)
VSSAAAVATRGQSVPARTYPTRTCVACRTERQKREFVRIVRAPDGTVAFDSTGRANGRGAYLCADASCWQAALKKKSIERALGGVVLPADVRETLATGMAQGGAKDGS